MVVSLIHQFLDKFFNDPTPGHEKLRLILLMIVIYGGILIGLIASCIYMRDTKQSSTLSKEQRAEMESHRKKSVQFQTEFEFEKKTNRMTIMKRQSQAGIRQRSKSEFEVSQSSFGDDVVDTISGKFTPVSKTKLKHHTIRKVILQLDFQFRYKSTMYLYFIIFFQVLSTVQAKP